jgi:hypothetical protein
MPGHLLELGARRLDRSKLVRQAIDIDFVLDLGRQFDQDAPRERARHHTDDAGTSLEQLDRPSA